MYQLLSLNSAITSESLEMIGKPCELKLDKLRAAVFGQ